MARQRTTTGKVRLTEVAKLAGVSPITASRFFRNPEALSAGKRERVESAARELGYVPDLAARALASQRTEVIGVLIPSLTNNVFSDVLRGIYDALQGSRYSIQLVNTRYSFLQEEKLLRLFQAQRPAQFRNRMDRNLPAKERATIGCRDAAHPHEIRRELVPDRQ